jgi:hypothetical protein
MFAVVVAAHLAFWFLASLLPPLVHHSSPPLLSLALSLTLALKLTSLALLYYPRCVSYYFLSPSLALMPPFTSPSTVHLRAQAPVTAPPTNVWRLNLFRVLMTVETNICTPATATTNQTCLFGAFSPTFVNPPAFHHPEYFSVAVLA